MTPGARYDVLRRHKPKPPRTGRLKRPYIPLGVRCKVAMRQILQRLPELQTLRYLDEMLGLNPLAFRLEQLLDDLARLLGDDQLRLDHNPALGLRDYDAFTDTYDPPANSPDHLEYKTAEKHDTKTFRGEGAKRGDVTEIARDRRRIKKRINRKPKRKIRSRGFSKQKRRMA